MYFELAMRLRVTSIMDEPLARALYRGVSFLIWFARAGRSGPLAAANAADADTAYCLLKHTHIQVGGWRAVDMVCQDLFADRRGCGDFYLIYPYRCDAAYRRGCGDATSGARSVTASRAARAGVSVRNTPPRANLGNRPRQHTT